MFLQNVNQPVLGSCLATYECFIDVWTREQNKLDVHFLSEIVVLAKQSVKVQNTKIESKSERES